MNRFCNSGNRPKPIFLPPVVWEQIQRDYVLGLGSTRTLAQKFGVKLSTLQARCKREGWVMDREERRELALEKLVMVGNSTGLEL